MDLLAELAVLWIINFFVTIAWSKVTNETHKEWVQRLIGTSIIVVPLYFLIGWIFG